VHDDIADDAKVKAVGKGNSGGAISNGRRCCVDGIEAWLNTGKTRIRWVDGVGGGGCICASSGEIAGAGSNPVEELEFAAPLEAEVLGIGKCCLNEQDFNKNLAEWNIEVDDQIAQF